MATKLCHLEDIPDQSGRGFEVKGDSLVVVRQGDQLFAYQNICPHIGTPLNWMPDQFMDYDKRYIQCATHGALFETSTGLCIKGPCSGSHLKQLDIGIIERQVYLL